MKIEVTKIMSAKEARKIVEEVKTENRAKEDRQRQEYKDKCKAEATARFNETIKVINEIIKEAAKEGKNSVTIILEECKSNNINNVPYTDFIYLKDLYEKILVEKLGYSLKIYWYSDDWRVEIGEAGYIYIEW